MSLQILHLHVQLPQTYWKVQFLEVMKPASYLHQWKTLLQDIQVIFFLKFLYSAETFYLTLKTLAARCFKMLIGLRKLSKSRL